MCGAVGEKTNKKGKGRKKPPQSVVDVLATMRRTSTENFFSRLAMPCRQASMTPVGPKPRSSCTMSGSG